MAGDMSSETADVYLEACRNEYLSQESQNREFQSKFLGFLTFGMALLAVAGGLFIEEQSVDSLSEVVMVCGIVTAFFGLATFSAMVLRPQKWQRPFEVTSVKDHANKDQPWMAEWVADSYMEAVTKNWPILDHKAKYINWIVFFAVSELGLVLLFKVWPLLSIFCV